MAIAEIHVTLKPALLDTQGATVAKALQQLGFDGVRDVRIGKFITVEVDDSTSNAQLQNQLEEMCRKLLANPVIEDYEIALDAVDSTPTPLQRMDVQPLIDAPLTNAPQMMATAPNLTTGEVMQTVPSVPVSAMSPSEQLASATVSRSDAASPNPFAIDAARFDTMSATDKLALQEMAWRTHGIWIRDQLNNLRAQWILCAGETVVESGTSLDTFPSDTRRAQVAQQSGLVPWVFVRPPNI